MKDYEVIDNWTIRNKDGDREPLANFFAEIIEEIHVTDGRTEDTILVLTGKQTRKVEGEQSEKAEFLLPAVRIETQELGQFNWVLRSWGTQAVIFPGTNVKEDLRTAIQMMSRPRVRNVYRHIGWAELGGKKAYLHAGGAITASGNDSDVEVSLPQELSKYSLTSKSEEVEAIKATLDLVKIAPPEISWVLLAATFAPLFGPVDFAVHLTGRTGTYKSELISLWQSHYGSGMDARNLPGSWSSTPNAIEAQAFLAKNAAFTLDDFVPSGSSWQLRAYQTTADKIIRAQGNQAGRARLTDVSQLQQTYYPRGIILSTGEDTPEGHSVRARMMIMEISPGDIKPTELTKAQKKREAYPKTTETIIRGLIKKPININPFVEEWRDKNLDLGHTRTPSMFARLIVVGEYVINKAVALKAISQATANKMEEEMVSAITLAAEQQASFLESADPCDAFCCTIRHCFAAGLGHVRTLNGGIPKDPTRLGWTTDDNLGDMPTFRSHGPQIGWVDWNSKELLLDAVSGLNTVKKVAGNDITLTKQTLIKRLKDASLLTRTDDQRQRNTVRITAENHPRTVLALSLPAVLDSQEGEKE